MQENIKEIRVKKFSIIRTAVGSAATYAFTIVILAIAALGALAT